MIERVFAGLVYAADIYATVGLIVALLFIARWRKTFDPSAADGSWGFCVLVVPGIVALWPVIVRKVIAVSRGGTAEGDAESPVAAEKLRRNHQQSFVALAFAIPVIFVVALALRAPRWDEAKPLDIAPPRPAPDQSVSTTF